VGVTVEDEGAELLAALVALEDAGECDLLPHGFAGFIAI